MFKTRFISMLVLLMTAVTGAVAQAAAPALNLTSPAVGQVIGDDGKNYDYASLPGGVTAVAKICYVSGSNGLALALADEGQMNWSTAMTTCAAHTPAFTGGTWKLATKDEWTNMITAAGGYTNLRDGFSSVGGSNLQSDCYWSSTEYDSDSDHACDYYFDDGDWSNDPKVDDYPLVRACLAFEAQGSDPEPTYTVTLKEGTEDATNWTIAPAEATTTGVAAGTEVKATYGGTKKVKSVKAVKKAAAAPAEETVTWDNTNVFVSGNSSVTVDKDNPYTYGGVSISFSGDSWLQLYDSGQNVTKLIVYENEVCTFTAPSGKKFTRIEITDNSFATFTADGDWTMDGDKTAIWSGTASNTVTLGSNDSYFTNLKSIVFTMEEAAAPAPTLAETLTTAGMTVKVNYNYNGGENSCSFLSNGDGTYTFQSGEGNAGDADHRAKALVVEGGKLVFKQNFYSSFDNMYDLFGFSVTFDTSNNTYSLWLGLMAESNVNPSFISVEVNGTQIAVTAAQ